MQANLRQTTLGVKYFLLPAEGHTPEQIRAPMTKIIGRFQILKYMTHPHLCAYIDIVRGKHERIYVISEHFHHSLAHFCPDPNGKLPHAALTESDIKQVAYQTLLALQYLGNHELAHRSLCIDSILLDEHKNVKLADYGMFHMTNQGTYVKFPIGYPNYMAPEVVSLGPQNAIGKFDRKSDIWSLGMILTEIVDGRKPFGDLGVYHTFLSILNMLGHDFPPRIHAKVGIVEGRPDMDRSSEPIELANLAPHERSAIQKSRLDALLKIYAPSLSKYSELFEEIIRHCLTVDPKIRPDAEELLLHPYFLDLRKKELVSKPTKWVLKPHMKSANVQLRQPDFDSIEENLSKLAMKSPQRVDEIKSFNPSIDSMLSERPVAELFHFWKLAGGNIEYELQKLGIVSTQPPIHKVPYVVRLSGESKEPSHAESSSGHDPRIVSLPLDMLRKKLIDHKKYLPSMTQPHQAAQTQQNQWTTLKSENDPIMKIIQIRKQHQEFLPPLEFREQDIDYQRQRIAIFKDIMQRHGPIRADEMVTNAIVDIPPSLRGEIWAILLNVTPELVHEYELIDKEKPCACDQQISVDIPRCHQYHELLSSPEGHNKFRRILKAWIFHNPTFSYWQGLDSLCAPFLSLNFNNEARAFACLHQLTTKFLRNFFLPDNSVALQETLMLFDHTLMYHDPELGLHLKRQGFIPEMFAIPWVLTLFSHVFPLDTTYIVWDTLLATNSTFICSLAVSILKSLRHFLLPSDLNSCIVIFSNLPTINIDQCIAMSLDLHTSTPESLVETLFSKYPSPTEEELQSSPPLQKLKEELVGRIKVRDLKRFHKHMHIIDLRPEEEYNIDSVIHSSNLPPPYSDEKLVQILAKTTNAHIVIADEEDASSMQIAERLVRRLVPRVSVLTKGIRGVRREAPALVQATRDWQLGRS